MVATTAVSSYVGERNQEGNYNGKGTLHYRGTQYSGEWQDGKMNGKGSLSFQDGGVYKEEWKS